jgi:hypothetical protein
MPALTRRRSPDHRHDCRQVYYGDVHAGNWRGIDNKDDRA